MVECVANFSEGKQTETVDAIVRAIDAFAPVLHRTSDADHNRSVITFAGEPERVLEAALAGIGKAVESIDLNKHRGVHPRIGAADVVPFVPLHGISMDECVELSVAAAEQIWQRFGVPVYLYEYSARRPERKKLENIRRGGLDPDVGGPEPHPTAGAVVVGARKILVAYNVNLATSDVGIAKRIAARIRESSGGFQHVKALGLMLDSRSQAQVSVNLTDFEATPLHVVFDAIREHARELGTDVASSELIGLIPRQALLAAAEHYFRFENLRPDSSIEACLHDKLKLQC